MRRRDFLFSTLLLLADLALLNLVFFTAVFLRYSSRLFPEQGLRPPWQALLPMLGLTLFGLIPALWLSGGYRMPRRWGMNQAFPVAARALLVALPAIALTGFLLRAGVARAGLLITPSRFVAAFTALGLWIGLPLLRVLCGNLYLALYRRGVGLRRSIIYGEPQTSAAVAERIRVNPWLGESLPYLDISASPAQRPKSLTGTWLDQHKIDTIWLAYRQGSGGGWLPDLLAQPAARRYTWRMTLEHFEAFVSNELSLLTPAQVDAFYQHVRPAPPMPVGSVAFIGSRGVPASYGGVETYVEEISAHLVSLGYQAAVYCHTRYVTARGYHRGVELRFVPTLPTKHLETIIHSLLATLHVLLFCEEEIIHYQALGPATLAWLPRLVGRKSVVTVQGLDWQRPKWGWFARLFLRFGELASAYCPNAFILVSKILEERYSQRYHKNGYTIPNGFNPPEIRLPQRIRELGLQRDEYLLFVGRLAQEKGCHTLLEAYKKTRTDKALVIAGKATFANDYYRQLTQAADSLDRVHFLGHVQGETLQELYSNAYLVIHPSEMEGLSISLLEALSYHNCLLVSNAPENLEAVGGSGFTFRRGDSDDLARQLQSLLDDPNLIEQARAHLSAYSSRLHWEAVARQTAMVYEALGSY